MAVSFINDAGNSGSAVTSVAVTHGFTLTADDLLVALIHMNNNGVLVDSPHSGFTEHDFGNALNNTGGHSFSIQSKTTNGTEDADITFGWDSSTRGSVTLVQLRGSVALAADVFPASSDGEETGSGSTEGPSIVVAANSMTFCWHLQDVSGTPTTFTSIDNDFTVGPTEIESDQLQGYGYKATGAGATGETKYNRSTSQTHVGYSFSFKEGGAVDVLMAQVMM